MPLDIDSVPDQQTGNPIDRNAGEAMESPLRSCYGVHVLRYRWGVYGLDGAAVGGYPEACLPDNWHIDQ